MKFRAAVKEAAYLTNVSDVGALRVLQAFFVELEHMPKDETMRCNLGTFYWQHQKQRNITMADGREAVVKEKWKLRLRPHPRFVHFVDENDLVATVTDSRPQTATVNTVTIAFGGEREDMP